MELSSLTAVSPIDVRSQTQTCALAGYFSEYALIRYRLRVEIEYFIALGQQKLFNLPASKNNALRKLYEEFNLQTADAIKQFERVTNHDVKALEYHIKKEMDALGLGDLKEFVHFGLTSEDVNNTAVPLMWKEALEFEFYPSVSNLIIRLRDMATAWKHIPLLARTHGHTGLPHVIGKRNPCFCREA